MVNTSCRGNVDNLGFFANSGYQFSDDMILSFYGRGDNHKTTGLVQPIKSI